ncbi:MAG: RES family NAD+ phosphorylase [Pseudomonadales bacterium]|nr:RES family NAD+ phosphorylase [Pseudomonadales bacterium]
MRLWRISNYADLKGVGGLKTPGRWHNKGIPVVYLSESPALAMLEVLVHFELSPDETPDNYQLLEVEYTNDSGIQALSEAGLPKQWYLDDGYTRLAGDEWLASMQGVLLKVPSAVVPHSYNYLLNPRHELAKEFEIIKINTHPFDLRLV